MLQDLDRLVLEQITYWGFGADAESARLVAYGAAGLAAIRVGFYTIRWGLYRLWNALGAIWLWLTTEPPPPPEPPLSREAAALVAAIDKACLLHGTNGDELINGSMQVLFENGSPHTILVKTSSGKDSVDLYVRALDLLDSHDSATVLKVASATYQKRLSTEVAFKRRQLVMALANDQA